jgi:DNA-binding SARP family transcriptional activator
LADVDARALESYATACLELGGAEGPAAERAARQLIELAPLRETGHLLLMRALAARGNVAEALTAYQILRTMLREELGVSPGPAIQEAYSRLLA